MARGLEGPSGSPGMRVGLEGRDDRWEAGESDRAGTLRLREGLACLGSHDKLEGRTGAVARSVHSQVLLRMGCPLITGPTGTHAHTNSPPLLWSLPRAPLRSSPASFCTIVLTFIGTWKHCKNASVFSYMEIVTKKVLVWGKVISFLEGGEASFSGGGDAAL